MESNTVSYHTSDKQNPTEERDVRFIYYEYDYRQDWVTRLPVTNYSKLVKNLRKKTSHRVIGFHMNNNKLGEMHVKGDRT